MILATALVSHPSTAVAFRYRSDTTSVTFRAGAAPADAQSTTVDLHNGWSVKVSGPTTGDAILANDDALMILFGGIALMLLLAAVIYLLGTSRSRAVQTVRDRTAELRQMAFQIR